MTVQSVRDRSMRLIRPVRAPRLQAVTRRLVARPKRRVGHLGGAAGQLAAQRGIHYAADAAAFRQTACLGR